MAKWDEKTGRVVQVERTVDEVRKAWSPYFKVHDEIRELMRPDAPMLYSAEHKRGRNTTVDVVLVGPDTVLGTFDEGDRQGEVIIGMGHMAARAPEDVRMLLAEVERLGRELAETEAARVEAFEMARKFIVDDSPPTEEAMRYGREVVAPMVTAEFAAAHGAPPIEACTVRAPDCLSGVYRCFVMGSKAAVGKGDTEALAYADFVTKWVAAKAKVTP